MSISLEISPNLLPLNNFSALRFLKTQKSFQRACKASFLKICNTYFNVSSGLGNGLQLISTRISVRHLQIKNVPPSYIAIINDLGQLYLGYLKELHKVCSIYKFCYVILTCEIMIFFNRYIILWFIMTLSDKIP